MLDKEYQSQLLIRLNRMELHSSRLKVIKQAAVRGSTAGFLLLSILIVSSCTTTVSPSASSDIASNESEAIVSPKSNITPEVLPSSKVNGKSQMAIIIDKEWVYIKNGGKVNLGDSLLMELFLEPYPPTRLRAFLDVYITRGDMPVTDAKVEIVYDMLGMFHGPFNFEADDLEGGHYLITVDYIMFGAWEHMLVVYMPEKQYEVTVGIIVFPTVISN